MEEQDYVDIPVKEPIKISYRESMLYKPTVDVFQEALKECIEDEDTESAAKLIRMRRDALLEMSDAHMTIDRINLMNPDSYTLTGIIKFIRSFVDVLHGDWATYRQALRDLPKQKGFPFNVEWPERPEDK